MCVFAQNRIAILHIHVRSQVSLCGRYSLTYLWCRITHRRWKRTARDLEESINGKSWIVVSNALGDVESAMCTNNFGLKILFFLCALIYLIIIIISSCRHIQEYWAYKIVARFIQLNMCIRLSPLSWTCFLYNGVVCFFIVPIFRLTNVNYLYFISFSIPYGDHESLATI